jgi:hypothetical protein
MDSFIIQTRFVIKIDQALIEVHSTLNSSFPNQEIYCTGEVFAKKDLNSGPDRSDLLFSFSFVIDEDNNVSSIEVEFPDGERRIFEPFKDKAMPVSTDFNVEQEEPMWMCLN